MQTAPHVDLAAIDALIIDQHNTWHPEPLSAYGWTDEWFTSTFLPMVPVRESRQEAAALRNFARWERGDRLSMPKAWVGSMGSVGQQET